MEVPPDAVGRRVSCGGERATVRYVGPVPPTDGLWLGVEWDVPQRGKHDGSHQGVQYFTCRHPTGSSFVRPAKVSFGVDYLTAVRQAYVSDTDQLGQKVNIWPEQQKVRSLDELPSVLLNRCEVNGPGADGETRRLTPNVQWLDLSGTLLSCWEDVAAVTQQLDHLERLHLSNNRLSLPSDPPAHRRAFGSLRVLALNGCELTWPQVLVVVSMCPQLDNLSVEENQITDVQRPEGVLQCLRTLSLSSNPLEQDGVLGLSHLPRLEEINVSRTGLSTLRFEDAAPGCRTAMFPSLKSLNLDNNSITEWCVVDELAKLPSLVQFSCRGNRLVSSDGNPKTANQMLIAKLGQLVSLNSCQIFHEDRRGAELDYIKMFGEEWLKAGGRSQTSTDFSCRHPRYQSLIDKYGAPEEGEFKKPEPFALKNQLMKITFVFPEDAEREPIEKKLPASMVVQKVKGLLYRLLKVPAADLRLSYSSPKLLGTEFEIDSDLKTLQFYSIEAGDRVLVRWS
ncbi:tubulin-specific chaperone E [Brachyistius frenatus]|uniref:tubulin-specific chaperone E n=1 Tax=Brachyistius frenatus TaxID=100188 RepID=UPI0037E93E1E